MYSILNLYTF